jgi:hypothetical protein
MGSRYKVTGGTTIEFRKEDCQVQFAYVPHPSSAHLELGTLRLLTAQRVSVQEEGTSTSGVLPALDLVVCL